MKSKYISLLFLQMLLAASVYAAGVSAPVVTQPGYGLGARFMYSSASPQEGRAGIKISFNYNGDTSMLAGFRLYEKKPGDSAFYRIAEFTNLLAISGATYGISGNWSLGRVGGTNGWLINRIIPGNPAGVPYYGSASVWPVGTYSYYITATDSQGTESAPSQTTSAHMLEQMTVLSPTAAQSPVALVPVLTWTTPTGWPGGNINYGIRLYEGTKEVWVGINPEAKGKKTYDGPALVEGTSYTIHIHGDYASYYSNPLDTYFSLPKNIETFKVSASPPPSPAQVVCARDVKLCSDGSYVTRIAPNCEFKSCPVTPPAPPPVSPTPKPTPVPAPRPPAPPQNPTQVQPPAKEPIPAPDKTPTAEEGIGSSSPTTRTPAIEPPASRSFLTKIFSALHNFFRFLFRQ